MKERSQLKKQLLTECKRLQFEAVEAARAAVESAQESVLTTEASSIDDPSDASREQAQHDREMYAQQLKEAADVLETLHKINPDSIYSTAGLGTIVVTDVPQKIFIAASIGKVPLNDETYIVVSMASPIAKAIVGKKAGDTYLFREKKAKVLEVF